MTDRPTDAARRVELADEGRYRAAVMLSPLNRRIQVLDYAAEDHAALAAALRERAAEHGFGKVFIKAREADRDPLVAAGLVDEATIRGYFAGADAHVLSLFLDPARRERPHAAEERDILATIESKPPRAEPRPLPDGYELRVARPEDAEDLAALYRTVFASYPFPIHDPAYLVETMHSHVVYRIVRDADRQLVAAASGERNLDYDSVEMTDFATLPSQRGLSLALRLLAALEVDMRERNVPNHYTIARARSTGMNRVFYNLGYELTGTLVNNCHISGQFEDMHVWCKQIEA